MKKTKLNNKNSLIRTNLQISILIAKFLNFHKEMRAYVLHGILNCDCLYRIIIVEKKAGDWFFFKKRNPRRRKFANHIQLDVSLDMQARIGYLTYKNVSHEKKTIYRHTRQM